MDIRPRDMEREKARFLMVHYRVYKLTDLDCRPTAMVVVNLIVPRPSTGSKSTEVGKFLCLQCSGHSK